MQHCDLQERQMQTRHSHRLVLILYKILYPHFRQRIGSPALIPLTDPHAAKSRNHDMLRPIAAKSYLRMSNSRSFPGGAQIVRLVLLVPPFLLK